MSAELLRRSLAALNTSPAMNTTTIISLIALAAALCSLWVALRNSAADPHYYAEISCSRYLDDGGKERVSYSFSHWHDNTVFGKTVGRLCIALARRRYDRLCRPKKGAQEQSVN